MRRSLFRLILCLAAALPAQAQQQFIKYSSGTGFYINREGHVITNAHVVRACESITVKGPQGDIPATLVASDTTRDLAVLKISGSPQTIAPLRWNIADVREGTQVWLYGFPGDKGAQGQPSFTGTSVAGLKGPTGEPQWLQLKSVAQHGNSGGPVLDATGNVIAVITGIAETYRPASGPGTQPELVGKADVAITLASLQDFLRQHQVPYYEAASGMVAYADSIIARNAAQFVFPVKCMQGIVTR